MKAKKLPVTYLLYPDEGHGFARPQNRLSFYAVAEGFLQQCLGGQLEPIGQDFDGSSVTAPEGATIVPGLAEALKEREDEGRQAQAARPEKPSIAAAADVRLEFPHSGQADPGPAVHSAPLMEIRTRHNGLPPLLGLPLRDGSVPPHVQRGDGRPGLGQLRHHRRHRRRLRRPPELRHGHHRPRARGAGLPRRASSPSPTGRAPIRSGRSAARTCSSASPPGTWIRW